MAVIRLNPFPTKPWRSLLENWEWPELPDISETTRGLDIYETKDAIVANAAVSGIPEDKIDITCEKGICRISGEVEEKKEEKEDKRYLYRSVASQVNYAFRIPESVEDEPKAELGNGVVTLTFKKLKEKKAAAKKITVKKKSA